MKAVGFRAPSCQQLMLPAEIRKPLNRCAAIPARRCLTTYSTAPVGQGPRASGKNEDAKVMINEIGDAARGLSATFCQGGSVSLPPGGLQLYFEQARGECEEVPDTVYEATTESPRGEALFGTLVVCLPSAHTGGQLRVRHGSATANFDWAKRSGDSIPWVALYSGCELEMAKITSDYRITLTYHLFADVGRQSPLAAAADWSALPLCRALRSALGRATFLPEGGVLGFRCQFRYPHTSNQFAQRPASLLKGADAVLFAAMRQLGLRIRFAHVYKVWKSVEGKRRGMEEEDDDEISDEVKRMDNIKRRLVRARLEAEAAAAAISDVLTALMRAEPEDENGIDPDDILLPSQSVADRIGTAVTQRSEEPVRYRAQTEIVAPLCAWEYQENEGSLAGSGTWEDSFPFCFPVLRNGADVKWAVKGPTYWEAGKLSVEGTGWYRAASEAIYCAAAILVTVPGWGSEQRSDLIEESAASGSHAE